MIANRDEMVFEIVEKIGVLNVYPDGWKKEINLVRWNGNEAKYDIRNWSENHKHMSRGITLSGEEMNRLKKIFKVQEIKNPQKSKQTKVKDYER